MDVLDTLAERNAEFAAGRLTPGLRIIPSLKVFIIGCVDPRVDPAEMLGVALGEAAVLRNIGGRVTPAVLDELALLRKLTQSAGGDFDQGWNFVVLQHTDCGILRMQGEHRLLADYFGVDPESLPAKAVGDPYAAVEIDVAALRGDARLPAGMRSSGAVYDVTTGLLETVVKPLS